MKTMSDIFGWVGGSGEVDPVALHPAAETNDTPQLETEGVTTVDHLVGDVDKFRVDQTVRLLNCLHLYLD